MNYYIIIVVWSTLKFTDADLLLRFTKEMNFINPLSLWVIWNFKQGGTSVNFIWTVNTRNEPIVTK